MRKITKLAFALALSALAFIPNSGSATTCEQQCYADQPECKRICSKNPCLISCEDQLRFCLAGCGSTS
jgi:hypothetical protein